MTSSKRVRPIAAALLLLLSACARSGDHGAAGNAPAAAAEGAPAPDGRASGAHNWRSRTGDDYVYQGEAVGAEAKSGSAIRLQTYRYLGERDGTFTIAFAGDTASCTNPCQEITVHDGMFHDERVAFDPDSLIGAVFTDAFNGQLQVYGAQSGHARSGPG